MTTHTLIWSGSLKSIDTLFPISVALDALKNLHCLGVILGGKGADAFGAGKIYHMALTFNRGAITFYFEGALVSSKVHGTAGIALLPHTSADLRIGGSEFAPTYFWDGVIEEVRFSQIVRYSGSIYTIPTSPFTAD